MPSTYDHAQLMPVMMMAAEVTEEGDMMINRAERNIAKTVQNEETTKMDDLPLSVRFYKLFQEHKEWTSPCVKISQEKREDLILETKKLYYAVEQASIFSENEDIDDVNTQDLKYLILPSFLGDFQAAEKDMKNRDKALSQAVVSWQIFLSRASRFNLIDSDQQEAAFEDLYGTTADDNDDDNSKGFSYRSNSYKTYKSSNTKEGERTNQQAEKFRQDKINRFKRNRELTEKIDFYFTRRNKLCPDDDEDNNWASSGVDDDTVRDMIQNMLRRAVLKAIDDIDNARREIPMIQMFNARGGMQAPRVQYVDDETRKKPWQLCIRDPSELHKLFKDNVFTPDITMPTVTLAEYAEMEMEKQREQQEKEHEKVVAQYTEQNYSLKNNDHLDSVQERQEEDAAERKQRDWDDWVDFNPKGAGNKMTNTA